MAKFTDRQAETGKWGREFMERERRSLDLNRLRDFSLARAEFGPEGCMDECIWNHNHLCKGFLEDYKPLQEMYEITIGLCDPLTALTSCIEIFRRNRDLVQVL